jgi:tRNA A-37 threonylcarbamoyl transferase component Bud32
MSEAPEANPAITSLTAKAGDKVDNYTIMEQVGAGGTAVVFRGHDHVLNRNVAIKQLVVPPGDEGDDIRQRALAEASIHKRVAAGDPKLLVQYIDTLSDPRGVFLISEYVDGPSLEWILQQETQPMDQRQALGIIAASAKALDALHRGGVVHRDLKPSNILMPREGGLKLADFGLATIAAEQQTLDLGSVRYMAPEILQGEDATPKSDLYSLGIVAYEMLAGRENFNSAFRTILRDQRNQSMRWVKWHTNSRAKVTPLDQLVSDIPASLAELVARMMEKDPARRVGSCAELLEAIRMHFAQSGQGDQPVPGPHAAMAPPKIDDASETAAVPQKSKLPMYLGATLAVWLLAIAGFFIWQNQQQKEQDAIAQAALTTDIESADKLIRDLQFEKAIEAYDAIPSEHAQFFTAGKDWGLEEIVESGSLKAQALLAAQRDDYITALAKALDYQTTISSASSLPSGIDTSLGRRDAQDLVDEYDQRAAFQQITGDIETMFTEGRLDEAIVAIRQLKADTSANSAQADLDQIAAFESRHASLIGEQRINDLLAQANKLNQDGELEDAIELLENEIEDKAEKEDTVDPRVATLAAQFNRRLQIEELEEELADAEQSGDAADVLAAMKDLQQVQPTQGMKERIAELEIEIMLSDAEEAIAEDRPGSAESILLDVLDRDEGNTQATRLLASLKDARMKIETERQADELLAQNKPQEAIAMYQKALTFGPDTNGSINEKIARATGRVHLAESEAAFEAGELAKAQDRLDKAKAALGDIDAIADLQDKIDELREYTLLVAEGDTYFKNDEFGRAKAKYLDAKKIFDSEAINAKVRDCDFGIWLATCDRAILSRDWPQAESALKRAEEIKVNDQTRARRAQIENRIQ